MAGASVSCTHLRPRPATMMAAASPSSHRQLATLVSVSGGPLKPSILRIAGKPLSSASFTLRAAADDDGGLAVAEGEPAESSSVTGDLKQKLMGLLYGTDRGLEASSETRAEIVELITQLEANNPNPNPTDALPLLNGKWILAYDGYSFLEFLDRLSGTGGVFYRYTSFSQMFPLLGSGRLPALVKVGEISQTIESEEFTVQNSVQLVGPLGSSPVTTNAKFEIRSPKRVQIKFEEGIIGTPQLTDSIVIPEKVQFMGQNVDLSPLSGVITSIQAAASSVARTISGLPPIKFSIDSSKAESWLLTTYLDEELRISRADGSSVFVLIKDGSPLLSQ